MSGRCRHPRCGNAEWHPASADGQGFTSACEPFKLGQNECECRVSAVHGTRASPNCAACNGTGYLSADTGHCPRCGRRTRGPGSCSGRNACDWI